MMGKGICADCYVGKRPAQELFRLMAGEENCRLIFAVALTQKKSPEQGREEKTYE